MENNNDFIKDWLEGKISPQELQSRKKENDAQVQDFEELISRTAGLKTPDTTTPAQAWEKLSAHMGAARKPEARVVKMNRWIPLSIAASVSLLIVAFFVFQQKTIETALAETTVYALPDGSEVRLNAGSKISFARFAWSGERRVTLEGEAFFQVTKGSSFTVESAAGTVTVLGTSFNVNARPEYFAVSCYTGKVRVARNGKEVMLTKGLMTRQHQQGLTAAETFDDKKTTWRTGDFHFEGAPLHTVIEELERQYNITINFAGDGQRLYTGYFNNRDLETALQMVLRPMNLQYKHEKNQIIVQ
jgi:transmembrane sensor